MTEHLLAVNTMAPMALVRAAVRTDDRRRRGRGAVGDPRRLPDRGDGRLQREQGGLSAWLTALRPELRRRGVTVFDVRPPHIETGLAGRAIAGQAPPMKAAATVDELVALVVDGIRTGRRELRYDLQKGEFAGR